MTTHPDFRPIQERMKALGLYDAPIDDEWGPSMRAGILRALARLDPGQAQVPVASVPAKLKIPDAYSWLGNIGPLPRHLTEALALIGTVETPGAANNPVIMNWAAETGIKGYSADSVPWCGLFMAVVMMRAGRPVPEGPLWALNWGKFGVDGGQPELGDVLTFQRDGGGHVGIYIGEDKQGFYHLLGGNQSDKVSIMRIAKSRMRACRQPDYKVKPASVQTYIVSPMGSVSRNEV